MIPAPFEDNQNQGKMFSVNMAETVVMGAKFSTL